MADRATLTRELASLEGKLDALTIRMQQADVYQRHLHRSEPQGGSKRRQQLLAEMDRLMNRMRAVEAKLAILERGGKVPFK